MRRGETETGGGGYDGGLGVGVEGGRVFCVYGEMMARVVGVRGVVGSGAWAGAA